LISATVVGDQENLKPSCIPKGSIRVRVRVGITVRIWVGVNARVRVRLGFRGRVRDMIRRGGPRKS
jgi:hypothetical protein